VNGLYDGTAEGYQMTAASTGTLSNLSVYVDAATTATNLFGGIYSDNNGHPDTRLTGGSSTTFQKAAWNTIPVHPVRAAAGSKYWFALLGTGGLVKFRQKAAGGGWIDELNSVRTLTSLPSTWTTGTIYAAGAWTSVYSSGVASATPVAPSILEVSPTGFSWTAKVGASKLAPASVNITNTGTESLTFAGVGDQPWLAISSGKWNCARYRSDSFRRLQDSPQEEPAIGNSLITTLFVTAIDRQGRESIYSNEIKARSNGVRAVRCSATPEKLASTRICTPPPENRARKSLNRLVNFSRWLGRESGRRCAISCRCIDKLSKINYQGIKFVRVSRTAALPRRIPRSSDTSSRCVPASHEQQENS
jgi:hypothetical protein